MTARLRLPLLSLAMATAALGGAASAQSANDFSLQPAPTPTPSPNVQGPVVTDGAVQIRPRAIPTATPTPVPTVVPPLLTPVPSPSIRPSPTPSPRARSTPLPANTATAQPRSRAQASPEAAPPPTSEPTSTPEPLATPSQTPTPTASAFPVAPSPQASPAADSSGSSGLLPWLLGLAALLLAGGVFLFLRRRREVEPAPIEPPIVQRNTQGATSAVPTGATEPDGEALALQVEAIRLSRSFMNVTVDYRVTLRNRLGRALENATVEADLVSASNDRPLANQLAARDTALPARHSAARLGPGQSQRFEGRLQLPLAQVSVIRQGAVELLVPLLRARASAGNATALAKTYVIGQGAPGATRPQPFRMDEPPRSYEPLIQRALD